MVGESSMCANLDEKEDVCRAGEEGGRKERMTTGKFLSVDWPPPAAGSLFPKPCLHIHSGLNSACISGICVQLSPPC